MAQLPAAVGRPAPARRLGETAGDGGARYAAAMSALSMFKLFLTGYAVVGIAYVCLSSGALRSETENWWADLPQFKKVIFGSGLGATLLQTFL